MAIIRQTVRKALRECTLGRYDRTYRRPHRRQSCYGDIIMPTFYQPRPRPGFLIDTSSSMQNPQLARAIAELGGLTRQLGYASEVVVACCDAAVHSVKHGVQCRAGAAVRWRRNGSGRRSSMVRRSQERPDRSAGRRHRLLHAVAGRDSSLPGHHHSRRRWCRRRPGAIAAPTGSSRSKSQPSTSRSGCASGRGRRWRARVARRQSSALASTRRTDHSARLAARVVRARGVGAVDGHAALRLRRVRHRS